MERIRDKLLLFIKEELLVKAVILLAPGCTGFQDLEDGLQENPFPAAVHHGNQAICGRFSIMKIKGCVFILLLHSVISETDDSNSMDLRHILPPRSPPTVSFAHSGHNHDKGTQCAQKVLFSAGLSVYPH